MSCITSAPALVSTAALGEFQERTYCSCYHSFPVGKCLTTPTWPPPISGRCFRWADAWSSVVRLSHTLHFGQSQLETVFFYLSAHTGIRSPTAELFSLILIQRERLSIYIGLLVLFPILQTVKLAQSCPTLRDQARIPEWVAVPFSRESFQPRDRTQRQLVKNPPVMRETQVPS